MLIYEYMPKRYLLNFVIFHKKIYSLCVENITKIHRKLNEKTWKKNKKKKINSNKKYSLNTSILTTILKGYLINLFFVLSIRIQYCTTRYLFYIFSNSKLFYFSLN